MKNFLTIISRDIEARDSAPEWMLLFAKGWNELNGEGKYLVDEQAFQSVLAAFRRRGNDVVIDYEHQTLEQVQAPAAGWIKDLHWTDEGIMARVQWTDKGAAYVASKEYRYFSPVFWVSKDGSRLVSLDSVALTNFPKHNNLRPILAKMNQGTPDRAPQPVEDAMLKKILAKLGLDENATEEQVVQAIASLGGAGADVPAELLAALDLEAGADVSTAVATVHAAKQSAKGMVSREEFDRLKGELVARDAEEVVAKAMTEGKITPDQKEWATGYAKADLAGFRTFVAKAPVVVPVGNLPGKAQDHTDPVTDDAVLAVARQMDVDAEDLKKFGGAE